MKNHLLNKQAELIAMTSSLIFLCHPLQVESVAYITQRLTSLAAFFYLSSVLLYIKYRLDYRPLYFIGALITTIFGLLTKEMTVTLPLALSAYEFFFLGPWKENGKKRLAILLPFFIAIGTFILIFTQDRHDSIYRLKDQIAYHSFNWNYFFTEINVLRTYLRLFFLPTNLHHDYGYPISHSFFEVSTLLSSCLLVIVVGFAIYQFNRSRLISFSIAWFFIATLIEVIHPCFINQGTIYEHWLYLAMVGFALFCSTVLYTLTKNTVAFKILTISTIVVFSVLTYQRNKVWESDFTLWQDNVGKTPQNAMAYFGLGRAYGKLGNIDKETEYYEKAIALKPTFFEACNNLGVVYQSKGNLDKAMEYYKKAIELNPHYAIAYYNLGALHVAKGSFQQGRECYEKAIMFNPNYVNAYIALGFLYSRWSDLDKAMEYFHKAIEIDEDAINKIYGTLEAAYRQKTKKSFN